MIILRFLASLKLTVVCLVLVMVLITMGTLAQVHSGIFNVQENYFHSFFLYSYIESLGMKIPYFPGGFLLGALLALNLLAAFIVHFKLAKRYVGIWMIHLGLMLLIVGEFLTGMFAVESQIALRVGEVKNYSESRLESEFVITDLSLEEYDEVFAFSDSYCENHRLLFHKSLPFTLRIKGWYPNSRLKMLEAGEEKSRLAATHGIGVGVLVEPMPKTVKDNEINLPSCFLEIKKGNESLGVWLVSMGMPAPQRIEIEGRVYEFNLRRKRYYLPFSIGLEEFTHEKYPGTNIPKYFSSKVSLFDAQGEFERSTLIYMNEPLRIGGKSFYQASYGEQDMLSVLQVVDNPSRLVPYVACTVVSLGLLYHIIFAMGNPRKRRKK